VSFFVVYSVVQLIVVNVKKTPTFRNYFILHAFHRDNCTILHLILHTDNVRVTNSRIYKALFTLATTVAEFSEGRRVQQQSPNSATIAENGDSGRKRRLSPNLATVAEFGDKLSPFTATTVSSVDRV